MCHIIGMIIFAALSLVHWIFNVDVIDIGEGSGSGAGADASEGRRRSNSAHKFAESFMEAHPILVIFIAAVSIASAVLGIAGYGWWMWGVWQRGRKSKAKDA